jgi:hypothetical protein
LSRRLPRSSATTSVSGGKALADTISRYGLYAGATVTVVTVIVAIAPKLIARLQGRPEAQR